MHERNDDTTFTELFDKQVNAQKKKNFRGSHKLMKKCVMKMKQTRKEEKMMCM